ncbi:hypothetical protein D3C84_892110 [compost metagenome]
MEQTNTLIMLLLKSVMPVFRFFLSGAIENERTWERHQQPLNALLVCSWIGFGMNEIFGFGTQEVRRNLNELAVIYAELLNDHITGVLAPGGREQ